MSEHASSDALRQTLQDAAGVVIDSKLGEGGMGTVFKAYQPAMSRTVAIKTLRKHFYADVGTIQRFLQEARILASLKHPNIVGTYSLGATADQTPFIVMEYVQGETLADLLEREDRLNTQKFLQIFSQVLDALTYAHSRDLIHRDLKPSNVMITPDGQVKLMDFGIAKNIVQSTGQSVTATGEVIGSPMYMSPEQARAEKNIDARSDLYSVGCMMYEALEGKPPFQSDAAFEVLLMHANQAPPVMAGASPGLAAFIDQVMSKDAQARPQSALVMKEELLSAASSTASVKSNKPNKQRTKVLPIMTACFALAVIFGLTAVLSGPKQPEQATSMDTRGHEDSLEMAAMDALSHAQMAMWRMERERDRVRAQRAIDEFEKYLTRMDRMPGRQWRVESMRGTYHQLEGNNAKALSYFESALVHHKQYAHNECEKDALRLAIGQCQHATGQHKEAEQTYLKLLSDIRHRLAGSADTKLWQDGPLRYLIQHYGSTNNYDRALWASSELFDLYRKYRPTSDDAIPAQAYYGCYLARSGKNLNEGIKQLEQALAKQKAFYKRKPEAQVISFYFTILADLATAYELRGDKAKAERMRIVVGALTNDALQNKLPSPDSLEF